MLGALPSAADETLAPRHRADAANIDECRKLLRLIVFSVILVTLSNDCVIRCPPRDRIHVDLTILSDLHAQCNFRDFRQVLCNINAPRAIIRAAMVGAMAKVVEAREDDGLVVRARTRADALGRLYELSYEPIFRFCVHRLFVREIAEDVTSTVFLEVARGIRSFEGTTEQDFRNWLYVIAANQANAYIRKTSRRRKLLAEATRSMRASESAEETPEPDWPRLYAAVLRLKPQYQTIVTLRFFENLRYEQISQILNIKEATLRVTLHRILGKLRKHLLTVFDGEMENV